MRGETQDSGLSTQDSFGDLVRELPPHAAERSLALVGFMGIGKTTTGGELARRMGWTCVDTDDVVEATSNMTIREIFDWFGEPRFRELEQEVVAKQAQSAKRILALGGGAFVQPASRSLLLDLCLVVYLAAPWTHVATSIRKLKNTRPLLRARSMVELQTLFAARHAVYDQAHLRISVPGRTPGQVAQRILELSHP